jgi:hypothetical protein
MNAFLSFSGSWKKEKKGKKIEERKKEKEKKRIN